MGPSIKRGVVGMLAAGVVALGACTVRGTDDAADTASATHTSESGGTTAAPPAPAQPAPLPTTPPAAPDSMTAADPTTLAPAQRPRADMRIEVDVATRKLHVYRGEERVATHPVAVGSKEWPTQPGEWVVSQVVFNPEWVPPDESWADEREPKAPGAPDNPLGRAQLIYDPPRTVHGTDQPTSIGKAVSHGSIRMRNETITALARDVMAAAGVEKDEAWYRRVQENRTEKAIVDLPRVVPIRVR